MERRRSLKLAATGLVGLLLLVMFSMLATQASSGPRPLPPPFSGPFKGSPPGYCLSYGGSTEYESITSVTLTVNPGGTMKLVVQIYIANPTGCTPGEPCPEYDNSPEYVNVWIDWNGDKTWDASEKVMDKALTGYLAINYRGTMTAICQFSPPDPDILTDEPTWLRANLGWGYDPNDPCEEYWTWGNVVDKQIDLKPPEIKSITAQGIAVAGGTAPDGNNPETGSPVRLEATIEVPTGYEVTKCSWTGNLTPGGGVPANNCRYEYTPARGPGPHVNTYGEKKVKLTVTYKHTASGATGQVSKDHTYKVFFKKTGDDDGDSVDNWYEYWSSSDDSVNTFDSTSATYIYMGGSYTGNQFGEYDGNVANPHYSIWNRASMSCAYNYTIPGYNFNNKGQGCDCVEDTLTHESTHQWVDANWHSGQLDSDGDELPDAWEDANSAIGFDKNNAYSFPGFPYGDDEEVYCEMQGFGQTGTHANDWANLGKNSSPSYKRIIVESGTAATLTGFYSDYGVDTNGNGLYDSLAIEVGVNVVAAGTYTLFGNLYNSNGNMLWAENYTYLDIGNHSVVLVFDGLSIYQYRVDGPYVLEHLVLFGFDIEEEMPTPYDTAAYNYTNFERPIVVFTGNYTDTGMDTDGDSLNDLLRINVGLDVEEAGTYIVIGELEGSEAIAVAQKSASLSTGSQSVDLDFNGRLIFQHRKDGPYHLRKLRVEDAFGNRIDFIYDAYTTSAYTHDQFQRGVAVMNIPSYTDQGLDLDSDGDYDYLRVEFQLDVDQEGAYRLLAALNDSEGETIASIVQDLSLSVGANPLSLDFPGGAIYEHGVDGPYQLASVALLDADGTIVDYQQMAHNTQAYSYTDFSPPLISLTGDYQDYGQDTDGDGLYDYLNIDISVIPSDAGVIVAQGRLVDSTGQEIEWAENNTEMEAGAAQTITLSFTGELIRANGRDGPFELRDLYVYHTGDPEQGAFAPLAYTTAAYSYTDFYAPEDTVGVYRSTTRTFYLKNTFTGGPADFTFTYGAAGDTPLVGDWDGDGIDTPGVYRPTTRTFYLKNEFAGGPADFTFTYGAAGDTPLVGDWDGVGGDTVGVYRASTRTFYLKNEFTGGAADFTFTYGAAGDTPLVGDWDGNGTDTPGVYRESTRTFYLKNEFAGGPADFTFTYGAAGDMPLVGRWQNGGGLGSSSVPMSMVSSPVVLVMPNPVILGRQVTFHVLRAGVDAIQVSIYDLGGGLVYQSELVSGQSVTWDLRSEQDTPVANGIYLYAVTVKAYGELISTEVGKLLIFR